MNLIWTGGNINTAVVLQPSQANVASFGSNSSSLIMKLLTVKMEAFCGACLVSSGSLQCFLTDKNPGPRLWLGKSRFELPQPSSCYRCNLLFSQHHILEPLETVHATLWEVMWSARLLWCYDDIGRGQMIWFVLRMIILSHLKAHGDGCW